MACVCGGTEVVGPEVLPPVSATRGEGGVIDWFSPVLAPLVRGAANSAEARARAAAQGAAHSAAQTVVAGISPHLPMLAVALVAGPALAVLVYVLMNKRKPARR